MLAILLLIMQRFYFSLGVGLLAIAAQATPPFIHETDKEFFATGDFDGDGRTDVLVVNRQVSKQDTVSRYRIAYQTPSGDFHWTRVRSADLANVTGVAVGRLLQEDRDALAVAVPDGGVIHVLDATDPSVTPELVP
jgi:hypothetical protein